MVVDCLDHLFLILWSFTTFIDLGFRDLMFFDRLLHAFCFC
ncbi:hypothetical protein SynSYN20_02147 [Synechococcus sp. SYN20]|nr:hypothetical protein SynMVIR181_01849 [Synechococcus sp. MVIR-18-1]QNJ26469.1 hypothetical protein SynSYN20_02147 [Synechococcus sp. SYN20]